MIDPQGRLRCDKCGKVIMEWLEGRGVLICPRSNCKHPNFLNTRLDKPPKVEYNASRKPQEAIP